MKIAFVGADSLNRKAEHLVIQWPIWVIFLTREVKDHAARKSVRQEMM